MAEQTAAQKSTPSSFEQTLLDKLSSLKREAYAHLDQALTFDSGTSSAASSSSETKLDTAIIMYERSLRYVEDAMGFYESHRGELSRHEDATRVYNQLVGMKRQTNERLESLKTQRMSSSSSKPSSVISPSTSDVDGFLDIGEDILNDSDCIIIDDIQSEEIARANLDAKQPDNKNKRDQVLSKLNDLQKATEIVRVDEGVQIFYIADDGSVSTPSYPTTLSIYSFDDQNQTNDGGKKMVGFIRVGSWMYPLVPNEGPAMKTNFNAYIFPNADEDVTSANHVKCSFVGVTFPPGTPDDLKTFFEDVLRNYDLLIYQNREAAATATEAAKPRPPQVAEKSVTPPASVLVDVDSRRPAQPRDMPYPLEPEKPKPKGEEEKGEEEEAKPAGQEGGWTADKLAQGLVTSATYVSQGIATGTEYANKYLKSGADKLKSQVQPKPQPSQIDPKYQHLMENVRYGTHVGVRVSSFLVNKLGQLAKYTAQTVGPHLRHGSTQLLSKTGVVSDKTTANGYIDGVCKVAHGSLESYGILYDSLEKAAKSLGKNFTENTVQIVEHKYGPDAAKTTRDGMYSVGNVAISVNNVQNFKIVRTFAKATAKEVISSSSKKTSPTDTNSTTTTTKTSTTSNPNENNTKKNA